MKFRWEEETGDTDLWILYVWKVIEGAGINGVILGGWKREKDEMSQDFLEYQYLKDEQEKSHQGR